MFGAGHLAQLNDGKGSEQVIIYVSKSLIPAERKYSITKGKCLAKGLGGKVLSAVRTPCINLSP